jgi:hypothetical protein
VNPFQIEQKRIEILSSLPDIYGRTKLWLLYDFYSQLLKTSDTSIINSYGPEFIQEFLFELKQFNAFYNPPEKTKALLILLTEIGKLSIAVNHKNQIDEITASIERGLTQLNDIMDGKSFSASLNKITFPLIEKIDNKIYEYNYGILESVKIKIGRSKEKDSFVIIPSPQKPDEQLEKQTRISFQLALDYLKNFKRKFHSHHEVIIIFENRAACYEGNSLAIALTIGFIEELTLHYNLPHLVYIKDNITSTGGLTQDGKIIPVSGNNIEQKVETVFFSPVQQFIIPKKDESAAEARLNLLKEKYPKRFLKLIAVETLNDLLDRRSIIEIKKQPVIIRVAKTIKKNWLTTILLMLLIMILLFIYIRDLDDNPYSLAYSGNYLLVKNKIGKLLWTIPTSSDSTANKRMENSYHRIIDIDNDGDNEVLICNESKEIAGDKFGRVICYNKFKNVIWTNSFEEPISTKDKDYPGTFSTSIIDTATRTGIKEIYLSTSHTSSEYPSSVFRINVGTGKKIPGVLWHPGRVGVGFIKKFSDGKKHKLVSAFINNGLNRIGFFVIDLDSLEGQSPTDDRHKFLNKPMAKFSEYIITPNSDYSLYLKLGHSSLMNNSIQDSPARKRIVFSSLEGKAESMASIAYEFTYDFKKVDVIISSSFEFQRDPLVQASILNKPFSNTIEFCELMKSQIEVWDGKGFVQFLDTMKQ